MATRGLCAVICGVVAATLTASGCSSGSSDVTVPVRAAQTDLPEAFGILHGLGLRVEITRPADVRSLGLPSVKIDPPAGFRVPTGSTIKITPVGGPLASPVVPKSGLPHAVVPNFADQPLSVAVRWADQHGLYWSIPTLPALQPSGAPTLFDAYRITGQHPAPSGSVVQGIRTKHGFKPTPLILTVVPS